MQLKLFTRTTTEGKSFVEKARAAATGSDAIDFYDSDEGPKQNVVN